MAHRRRAEGGFATSGLSFRTGPLLPFPSRGTREPEECQAVPARAGDRHREGAERGIMPVFIPESFGEDFHQQGPSSPLPAEQSARQRQPAILLAAVPVPSCRPHALAVHRQEVARRHLPHLGIPCDLLRPPARPVGEISFRHDLQTPGNPPEQMFPGPGARFFLKHLPILRAQTRQSRPAQALDFRPYRRVHSFGFLSVAVNHSPMNAPDRTKGKSKTTQNSLAWCRRPEGWMVQAADAEKGNSYEILDDRSQKTCLRGGACRRVTAAARSTRCALHATHHHERLRETF